jgi:hypothetical protein
MSAPGTTLGAQMQHIRQVILARHGIQPGMERAETSSASPLEDAARLATVNAHWGIASDLPVVGRVLVLFRRALRLLLRWYINPIVEQQNTFNDAAVRALYDLRVENEHLRAEVDRLRSTVEPPGE